MPRTCTICVHPERSEIDISLVDGEPLRDIARRVAVSRDALARHKADHLPEHLAKAREAESVTDAGDLINQVRSLQTRALGILDRAERSGDLRTALQGVRETRSCIELLAEVEGKLDRRNVTNISISPQWITVRSAILVALEPHPEARIAVASALASLDEGDGA
jgi:hypothetical protein